MWEKEWEVTAQAVKEAGRILRRLFGRANSMMKKGGIELVTEADLQAEKTILDLIHHHFPDDTILAEETGMHQQDVGRTWLVDPLDGTVNFAHGFPFFAVSIALEVEGQVVLGVVSNPCMEEHFEAVRGTGAFLNKEPIRVSNTKNLADSLLATGFAYDIRDRQKQIMDRLGRMVLAAQGVRRPGAASLDLCYVAAGRLDGFWEEGLKPWDTAAGMIILQEAGGKLSSFEGESYSPYLSTVLAANPLIHEAMRKLLRG